MATRALCVGGTQGIGYGLACCIAAEPGSRVIISGRNEPKTMPSNMEYRPLEASSMRAVKRYADEFKAALAPDDKLDYLILTTGLLAMAGRNETSEGIDYKMALHYYSRMLLIRELGHVLKPDAKVVTVLDSLRGNPADVVWDDLSAKKEWSLARCAKHCMAFTDAMMQWHATNQGSGNSRVFVHTYPRMVQTKIDRSLPIYLRLPASGIRRLAGMSADAYAKKTLDGVRAVAARGDNGNRWSFIDPDGQPYADKVMWTEADMDRVREHTWRTVDEAINKA
jgi:NAD(P)-dependent dehydrogenase (short-subunit alcohol dehydrogenase family)